MAWSEPVPIEATYADFEYFRDTLPDELSTDTTYMVAALLTLANQTRNSDNWAGFGHELACALKNVFRESPLNVFTSRADI